MTDFLSSGAGYKLKLSTVAVISGVVKDTRVVSGCTSSLKISGFIFMVNFVSAGHVISGVNMIVLSPRIDHVPRINGDIFIFCASSVSVKFILNAGA